jgi:hypothetical protein
MADPYKSGKDYLKTKEAEAKKINANRGFFDSKKSNGMDLLQDEAWKENKQFDKKKSSEKDSNELLVVVLVILVLSFYYFFM